LLLSLFLGDAVTLKLGAGMWVGLDLREEEAVLCFKMGLGLFLKNGLGVFLGALLARIKTGLFLAQAGCAFRLGLLGGDGDFGVPSPPLISSLLFSKDLTHKFTRYKEDPFRTKILDIIKRELRLSVLQN
jgi:hypothetical protein